MLLFPTFSEPRSSFQEINASSAEQRTGSQQVNKALTEQDTSVHQNAPQSEDGGKTTEDEQFEEY